MGRLGALSTRDYVLVFPSAGMVHGRAGTVAHARALCGKEEEANSWAPPVSEEERLEGNAGCSRSCVGPKADPRGRGKNGRGGWAMLWAKRRGGGRRSPIDLFYFLSLFHFLDFLLSYFEMV